MSRLLPLAKTLIMLDMIPSGHCPRLAVVESLRSGEVVFDHVNSW